MLGIGIVASGVVELVQPVFGRGATWSDFAADVVDLGIGIGAALAIIGLVRSYYRSGCGTGRSGRTAPERNMHRRTRPQ